MVSQLRFCIAAALVAFLIEDVKASGSTSRLRNKRQISCQAGCGPIGCCGIYCCSPPPRLPPPPPSPCCAQPSPLQFQLPPCCIPQAPPPPPPPPCCVPQVPQVPFCPPVCRPACAPACIAGGCSGGGCGRKRRDALRAERSMFDKAGPDTSAEESAENEDVHPTAEKPNVVDETVDDWGYNAPYSGFGNYNGGYGSGGNSGYGSGGNSGYGSGGNNGGYGSDYDNNGYGGGNGGYGNQQHHNNGGCRQCHSGPTYQQFQNFGFNNYGYHNN